MRTLLSVSLALAFVLVGLVTLSTPAPAADTPLGQKVFDMRTYKTNPGKLDPLNARFRDHTCKIFQNHGIELIGFWVPAEGDEAKDTLIYLVAFPTVEAQKAAWKAFWDDPVWKKVKADSEKDGVLVKEIKGKNLKATDYSPAPASVKPSPDKVFELRIYKTNPGKLEALHARFRDHTMKLFAKHGIESVGYWTPAEGEEAKDTLIYLVAFPNAEAQKKAWDAFRADPDWKKAKADSEKDGVLVKKVESKNLKATDYSPIR